ncbi:MAG: sulfatase [Planctomycetaceae bacterium]|nr:sulfatase [Planctomycetaceae bacterium]
MPHRLFSPERRRFLGTASLGIGGGALASLLQKDCPTVAASPRSAGTHQPGPHFPARAKRVIYLFQSGGPSQIDLFDFKPILKEREGQVVPPSVYPDERKTTMTSAQKKFSTAPNISPFRQRGKSGQWVSDLLPHLADTADDLCVVRSMQTHAINHDPAITFFLTGAEVPGRPSMGAWVSYGLGSENENLPTFLVLNSFGSIEKPQPLYNRLWGNGFLPSHHQGIMFRRFGQAVLNIDDPPGVTRATRQAMLEQLQRLNRVKLEEVGDPEIQTRISQYEMAFRMQMTVPQLLDFSDEPAHALKKYGPEVQQKGSYAHNCLVARRLVERDVRFIQLFHRGWDQHLNLNRDLPLQCSDVDQPTAALISDLKERDMLRDTLVIWGGEFGRTVYSQGDLSIPDYGRDHHPDCFTVLLAGGGVRAGLSYGATDDFSVRVTEQPMHVHDLQATILHLLGIDHERLTFRSQGRDFRLTDVHGNVVTDLLS